MESSHIILWIGGISVTGFLFLAGWMWYLNTEMGKRVRYEWLETTFKKEIKEDIGRVGSSVDRIEKALLGTLESEGIVTRVVNIEKNCRLHHDIKEALSKKD